MKLGCSICFLNSTNLIYRTTDISKCFRWSLRLRDNERWLYLHICIQNAKEWQETISQIFNLSNIYLMTAAQKLMLRHSVEQYFFTFNAKSCYIILQQMMISAFWVKIRELFSKRVVNLMKKRSAILCVCLLDSQVSCILNRGVLTRNFSFLFRNLIIFNARIYTYRNHSCTFYLLMVLLS